MASQLYVLDLPLANAVCVVRAFANFTSNPAAVSQGGVSETRIDAQSSADIARRISLENVERLKGTRGDHEDLSLYFWFEMEPLFDAELVFWADQLFPDPEDDAACASTFSRYLAFAETLRSCGDKSECVLSASETGDARDGRGQPWTYWW